MFEFKFGRRSYISKHILNPTPPIVNNTIVRIYAECRVHLKTRNGTYRVVQYDNRYAKITCNVWDREFTAGQRDSRYSLIPRSDIKCLHGHDKFR